MKLYKKTGLVTSPRHFEFSDYMTEEEGNYVKRAWAARGRAFLRALAANECKPQSLQLKETPGVIFIRPRTSSDITSTAHLCSEWGKE